MKLKKIILHNFRTINADVNPQKINSITMPNGSGKTSFIDAIKFGLTGAAPANIAPGDNVVMIEFEDGSLIERTAGPKNYVKVNGKRTTAKSANELVEKLNGIPAEHAKVICASEAFDLGPDEFQDLLMKYIPEQPDADILKGYFTSMTPDAEAEIDMIVPPMPEKFTLDMIGTVWESASEARRDMKRLLSGCENQLRTNTAAKPARSVSEIEKELAEVMFAEKNAAAVKAAHNSYKAAVDFRNKIESQIRVLQDAVNKNTAMPVKPEQLKENRLRRAKIANDEKANTGLLSTLNGNIDMFTKALEGLQEKKCPFSAYMKSDIICGADMSDTISKIESMIEENRREAERVKKLLSEADQEGVRLDAEYERLFRMSGEYEKRKRDFKSLQDMKETLKNTPMPVKPTEEEIDLSNVKFQIRQLQQEKAAADMYAEKLKLEKQVESLKKQIATYDLIVKAFSPKGEVMSNVIDHYLSVFENVINQTASSLRNDFKIHFRKHEGVNILIERSGNETPYEALSTGEKLLVSFLVLDMLNQLTGLGILVLDNLECLDEKALTELLHLIEDNSVQQRYDHIFLAGVDHLELTNALGKYNQVKLTK